MAMGRRKQEHQEALFVTADALPRAPRHVFYERLNRILSEQEFDTFVEDCCRPFYADRKGRPGLAPGVYFRTLFIGDFEGIDSERGMAWRIEDDDGEHPQDPTAKIMKLKDGSTHLAHKAEHVVDLGEEGHGAILAVVRHDANQGDTQTILDSVNEATRHLHEIRNDGEASTGTLKIEEVVTDKGYHSNDVLKDFAELELRTYVSEPDRGRRDWSGDAEGEAQAAVYANRRRIRGDRGKRLLARRGEILERTFAHCYETGAMRRLHVRGNDNIRKRLLLHAAAFNFSLVMRKLFGAGTPRGFADLVAALCHAFSGPGTARQTNQTMFTCHPRKTDGISPIALPA